MSPSVSVTVLAAAETRVDEEGDLTRRDVLVKNLSDLLHGKAEGKEIAAGDEAAAAGAAVEMPLSCVSTPPRQLPQHSTALIAIRQKFSAYPLLPAATTNIGE